MTATIRPPRAVKQQPPRARLSSMEILGFIDTPTWAGKTTVMSAPQFVPTPGSIASGPDPFDNWQPSDVGSRLLKGRVRWGLISALLLVLVLGTGLALWIYRQPAVEATAAITKVGESARLLTPALEQGIDLNGKLTASNGDELTAPGRLLALNAMARDLFELSADLPNGQGTSRTLAVDAASDALEGSRLLSDAFTFKTAVLPLLAEPAFETDPALVTLAVAASEFAEWRTEFDRVAGALPSGIMSSVSDDLALAATEFDTYQSKYLDALRTGDQVAARSAVVELRERLAETESVLSAVLSHVQVQVGERFGSALSGIDLLLG